MMADPIRFLGRACRRPRVCGFALTVAAILSVWPGQVQADELLEEYGFEGVPAFLPNWGAGYEGTYKPATGWKQPFVVSLDKADPHSGAGCMKIELQADGGLVRVHSPAIQVPSQAAGATVIVRAYIRAEGLAPESSTVGLMERGEGGKTLGYVGGKEKLLVMEPSESWQEVTFEGQLNAQTNTVSLMFTIATQTAPATLWLDDISVEWKPGT